MDFAVAEHTQKLLADIDALMTEHVIPLERAVVGDGLADIDAALAPVRAEVKRRGLWGPQIPRELGGLGLGLVEHALVSERLGRSPLGHFAFGAQAPDAGNLEILDRHGSPEQRRRFLEPLARGEVRSCFAMTEPDTPGSNPTQLACRATRSGDGWVISGRKWFTSSCDGAAFAVIMAVSNPDAPGHQRATLFVAPTETPGFERVRNVPVVGHAGAGYASHSEVRFHDMKVGDDARLGAEGAGFAIAQERLGPGRIHHCMRWLGICDRAFELACRRARARVIDGRETLGQKQFIQGWIAESRARISAARLLVLQAAWKAEGAGFRAAAEEISLIKFHVADVMLEVVDRAIQIHGAAGLTDETPLAWWYAQERGARIYDGPDEVHKIAAARRLLERA
jgi:alkylation response protein AidB-like acyl-CoA dehydrogenase